jgi:HAD superfamily hydrolase (TIGR01549 family)
MTDIKFVYFDHVGTLVYIKKDLLTIINEVLREFNYNFSFLEVKRAYDSAEDYWERKYLNSRNKWNKDIAYDYYSFLFYELGIEENVNKMIEILYNEWHKRSGASLYPDAIPCLNYLVMKEKNLGIITQSILSEEDFRKERLRKEGIEHYFSVVITTASIGYEKPDIRLYKKAIEMASCKPDEIMIIGDNYDLDIKVPLSLGMKAVLLDRKGESKYDCPKINSLIEIDKFIK